MLSELYNRNSKIARLSEFIPYKEYFTNFIVSIIEVRQMAVRVLYDVLQPQVKKNRSERHVIQTNKNTVLRSHLTLGILGNRN